MNINAGTPYFPSLANIKVKVKRGWKMVNEDDSNSLSTIVNIVAIVATVSAATIWITSQLNSVQTRLTVIESHIAEVWNYSDMQLYSLRLEAANKDLVVPRPEKNYNNHNHKN